MPGGRGLGFRSQAEMPLCVGVVGSKSLSLWTYESVWFSYEERVHYMRPCACNVHALWALLDEPQILDALGRASVAILKKGRWPWIP
jgi:hypothetical protein